MAVPSRRLGEAAAKSGRDRPNARGDATRMRILLKAEELFAQHGIAAVPLRDIGAAAGQKNNVAVQYHFGDRETLVREIATYRAHASEEMRVTLLADLAARTAPPGVPDIVDAFVRALGCHLEPDNHYLAFLSRYVNEMGDYHELEGLGIGTSIHTYLAMVRRLLPGVPEEILDERWMVMMTSAVHALARYQTAMRHDALPRPLDDLVRDLTAFLAAGLAAPASSVSPVRA